MKKIYQLLLLIIALSCKPAKDNETSLDSSQNNFTDSLTTQIRETSTSSPMGESAQPSSTVEIEEPFSGITNNFPEFSMATLTYDSLELEINNRMGKLIQLYDTIEFTMITSRYSWERAFYAQAQDGPGTMSTETESETKKWFFDKSNQLKAYTVEFEMDSDYPSKKSILYLFSNDSLIAISEQAVDDSEVTVTYHTRIVASQCPSCGVAAIGGHREGGEIRYLNEKDLAIKQKEFSESMPELISQLKTGRKKAKEDNDDFIFTVNRTEEGNTDQKSKAITYPVEFRVSKSLYPNYISKQ